MVKYKVSKKWLHVTTTAAIFLCLIFLYSSTALAESPPDREMNGIHYKTTLANGFYTAGIDFPAGEYDVKIISQNAEVTFYDKSGNSMKAYSYNPETKLHEFINLSDDCYIKVINGSVELSSTNISGVPQQPRNQKIKKSYKLQSGTFLSGKDFSPGTYDITAMGKKVSGTFSTNEPKKEIRASMNARNQTYKNIYLSKGMQLKLETLSVKLTPSK